MRVPMPVVLVLAFLLAVARAVAPASAQAPDALSKLGRGERVACAPAFPYFCLNIHVSCAGRTDVPAFAFGLRIAPGGAALDAPAGAEAFAEQYAGGRADWSPEEGYVVVRPAHAGGYIKLFQDGRYVFRHYRQSEGVMSRGTCA